MLLLLVLQDKSLTQKNINCKRVAKISITTALVKVNNNLNEDIILSCPPALTDFSSYSERLFFLA